MVISICFFIRLTVPVEPEVISIDDDSTPIIIDADPVPAVSTEPPANPESAPKSSSSAKRKKFTWKRTRGTYNKSFLRDPSKFSIIQHAVEKHGPGEAALRFLRLQYPLPLDKKPRGVYGAFDRLRASTLRNWFDKDGNLEPRAARVIESGNPSINSIGKGRPDVLLKHPDIVREIKNSLEIQRNSGAAIAASIAKSIIIGTIEAKNKKLLKTFGGPLGISDKYVRYFLYKVLGWTRRRGTTACQKLPANWKQQQRDFTYQLAYVINAYKIPPECIVNSDQTAVHLVPGGNFTYAPRGSDSVPILGADDKRQFTTNLASTASGIVLPPQAIFEGKTPRCHPQDPLIKARAKASGCHITQSPNHWSNTVTMCEYADNIIGPYLNNRKGVWLLDCFAAHRSKEFRDHMAAKHANIIILYIPANCTSVLQPADIFQNRPMKHHIKTSFQYYLVQEVSHGRMKKFNPQPTSIDIDTGAAKMKNLWLQWVLDANQYMSEKKDTVIKGWQKSGLLQAFDPIIQAEARELQVESKLFNVPVSKYVRNEDEPYISANDYVDDDTSVNTDVLLHKIMEAPLGDEVAGLEGDEDGDISGINFVEDSDD